MAGLLVTVEHGGCEVPGELQHLFASAQRQALLTTHRGYDPGTLAYANDWRGRFDCAVVTAVRTRLVVDLNRSPHNPGVFSSITRSLPRPERLALLERYHRPHWQQVTDRIDDMLAQGKEVWHVGLHSFTPILDSIPRPLEVGLLYDPGRAAERAMCLRWQQQIVQRDPALRVRRNQPYRGVADGLVTALRKRYPPQRYHGLELEINQKLVTEAGCFRADVRQTVLDAFTQAWQAG